MPAPLLAAACLLIAAGPAAAHAALVRADPSPGSTVRAAPQVVRAWFNEELDVKKSMLIVTDRSGKRADRGGGGVDLNDLDRKSMLVRVPAIGPGTYTVRWTAVSADDGFVARGSYRFTVATATSHADIMAMNLPRLKVISPASGELMTGPVKVVLETPADMERMSMDGDHMNGSSPVRHLHVDIGQRMNMLTMKNLRKVGTQRYEFTVGKVAPGKHTIRVYWADAKHKPLGTVHVVTITVK
jgi:methionine-rich copper-binding protein CopC